MVPLRQLRMSPELISFITTYGYAAVFLGCLIEGEALVIIASFLAFLGELSLPVVLLSAFFGTLLSDVGWFLLGRYSGTKFLERWTWLHTLSKGSVALVGRRPRLTAFLVRFIYGFRVIVPYSLGKTSIETSTYILYNALGVLLWVSIFGGIGYFFAEAVETIVGKTPHLGLMLIGMTFLLVVFFIYLGKITGRFIK